MIHNFIRMLNFLFAWTCLDMKTVTRMLKNVPVSKYDI